MSDASEHVLPTVEETIDGNKITFGKLSVTDRAKILRNVKAAAIAQHDKDTSVLPPEQQYIQRRDFNSQDFRGPVPPGFDSSIVPMGRRRFSALRWRRRTWLAKSISFSTSSPVRSVGLHAACSVQGDGPALRRIHADSAEHEASRHDGRQADLHDRRVRAARARG